MTGEFEPREVRRILVNHYEMRYEIRMETHLTYTSKTIKTHM
jgi:hypothetical protein